MSPSLLSLASLVLRPSGIGITGCWTYHQSGKRAYVLSTGGVYTDRGDGRAVRQVSVILCAPSVVPSRLIKGGVLPLRWAHP